MLYEYFRLTAHMTHSEKRDAGPAIWQMLWDIYFPRPVGSTPYNPRFDA